MYTFDIANTNSMIKEDKLVVKNITLRQSIMDSLLKQGVDKGFKNLKSYIEHLLNIQANK